MAHRFLNDPIYQLYRDLLQLMDRGRYEEIAEELRRLRMNETLTPAEECLRRLISARIAIFKGQAPEDVTWVNTTPKSHPWMEGESAMLQGVQLFHLQEHIKGSACFERAATCFKALGMFDREMLARFNVLIGKINAGAYPDLASELDALTELEKKIRSHPKSSEAQSPLACVLRQKCYAYQDQGRAHAALYEINQAIPSFEQFGTHSDFHLSLIQAADLAIEINEKLLARQYLERVVAPVEVRVEFPLRLVVWRLKNQANTSKAPNPDQFEYVSPYWKDKWDRYTRTQDPESPRESHLTWDLKAGVLTERSTAKAHKIKPASLEGRLLRALIRSRSGKSLLIELLWPEQHLVRSADDKFHRLVSRLNKKLGNVIEYDGQFYQLVRIIDISE